MTEEEERGRGRVGVKGKAKKKTRRRESEKKRESVKGSFGIINFIFEIYYVSFFGSQSPYIVMCSINFND